MCTGADCTSVRGVYSAHRVAAEQISAVESDDSGQGRWIQVQSASRRRPALLDSKYKTRGVKFRLLSNC